MAELPPDPQVKVIPEPAALTPEQEANEKEVELQRAIWAGESIAKAHHGDLGKKQFHDEVENIKQKQGIDAAIQYAKDFREQMKFYEKFKAAFGAAGADHGLNEWKNAKKKEADDAAKANTPQEPAASPESAPPADNGTNDNAGATPSPITY